MSDPARRTEREPRVPSAARETTREQAGAGADRTTVRDDNTGSGRETTRESTMAPVVPTFRLPSALAERYEFRRLLDGGHEARIALCEEHRTGHMVVIKLYLRSAVDVDALHAVSRGDPRHVLPSVVGGGEGFQWEIMEYLPLGSLAALIQARDGRPQSAEFVTDFVREITDAVDHLHSLGVTHRDLKPGNVLIRARTPLDLVIADFGISVRADGTVLADIAGTYAYAAPESLNSKPSPKGDWWAVGVMTHELLTGHHILADPGDRLPAQRDLRARVFEGTLDLADVPDDRWRLLLTGLLTRDRNARWAAAQVREWLDGGSPPVVTMPVPRQVSPKAVFVFAGQSYTDPVALTRALGTRWQAAEETLRGRKTGELSEFLVDSGAEERSARRMVASGDATKITFALQRTFTPEDPLAFHGRALDGDTLTAVAAAAQNGDADAATWIATMRDRRVLTALSHWVDDASRVGVADDRLASWWRDVDSLVKGWRDVEDIAPHLASLRTRWEGQLLAAAFDDETARDLRSRASAEATDEGDVPDWARETRRLARSVDVGKPAGTGVAAVAAAVLPAAVAVRRAEDDAARAAQAEAADRARREQQERARAESARLRRQRRSETGREFATRLWAVVFAAALAAVVSAAPMFTWDRMRAPALYAGAGVFVVSTIVFVMDAFVRRVRLVARSGFLTAGLVFCIVLWFIPAAESGFATATPPDWWLTVAWVLLAAYALAFLADLVLVRHGPNPLVGQVGANPLQALAPPRRLRVLEGWSLVPVILMAACTVGNALNMTAAVSFSRDAAEAVRLWGWATAPLDAIDAMVPDLPEGGTGVIIAALITCFGFVMATLYRDIARSHPRAAGWALSLTMVLGLLCAFSSPWLLLAPLAVGLAFAVGATIVLFLIGVMVG